MLNIIKNETKYRTGTCGSGDHKRCAVYVRTPRGHVICACPCHEGTTGDFDPHAHIGMKMSDEAGSEWTVGEVFDDRLVFDG